MLGAENVNRSEVLKYLKQRFSELQPGEYMGLRLLAGGMSALSGLYNDLMLAVSTIENYSGQYQIYCSLNPILSRDGYSINQMRPGPSFKDADVAKIKYILIDIDSIRPPDTAANEYELASANSVVHKVAALLANKGIHYRAFLSGNGYHLLVKVPSYATERSREVKRLLNFLSETYSAPQAQIDTTVYNPSRIVRVPGTLNMKGANTSDRPHRLASEIFSTGLLSEHDVLALFGNEIAAHRSLLIDRNSITGEKRKGDYSKFTGDIEFLDIVSLFKESQLYVRPIGNGKHIVLCPNRNEHSNNSDGESSTIIFEADFGKWPGFNCQHTHCQHLKLDYVLTNYFNKELVDRLCLCKFKNIEQNSAVLERVDDFILTNAFQLLNEEETDLPYVVDRTLFEGGLSLLASKPKVGKTTLLRSLAVSVSQGKDWLGFKTLKGRVIYIGLEEHRGLAKAEFKKLGIGSGENLFIHIAPAPTEAVKKLESLIVQHKPVLVIVDTMHKLVRFEDGNSYAEVNNSLTPLLTLARQYNCHVLCTHHLSKADRDPGDSILGSTAIYGAFDTLIFLTKASDERVIETIQRYGEPMEKSIVRLDPQTRHLQLLSLSENRKVNLSVDILRALAEAEGPLLEAQIIKAVGKRKHEITKELKELFSSQRIVRMGTGRKGSAYLYSLSANSGPPLEVELGSDNILNSTPDSVYVERK